MPNNQITIAGFTGQAANYDGTFAITGVNSSNNTFTYQDTYAHLPTGSTGGTFPRKRRE